MRCKHSVDVAVYTDNAVNGVPTCLSRLMRDARKSWGFTGYVTSDSDSVANAWHDHHYLNETAVQATADAPRRQTIQKQSETPTRSCMPRRAQTLSHKQRLA